MILSILLTRKEKKCFSLMGNNLKHISLILLCMLAIPAAYGQTKKVVRQPQNSTTQKSSNAAKKKQTSNTARRSSAKTAPKPKQPAAASNTPKPKQPAAGNYVDLHRARHRP